MDIRKPQLRLIRVLLLALFIAAPGAISVEPQAKVENKRVLILFSSNAYLPTQVLVERAMRSTLEKGSPVPVEVYTEYLDLMRTEGNRYENELVHLLQAKYEGKKFDVIFTITDPVLRMLLRNQAELFPDTPVVYLTLDPPTRTDVPLGPNVTGVWGEISFKPNLELAVELHRERNTWR
jgi:hypothetical protein